MRYYQVKQEYDNHTTSHGRRVFGRELYTEKEVARFKIPAAMVDPIDLSSRRTYWCFGARWMVNDPGRWA